MELAALFLKLGVLGFGGPAAHIALMEEEVVRRRGWLTREGFLDLLGATNLIPGPNSTEMAIHVGRERGGIPGLLVSGGAFILPAMLITLACAWVYVRYGTLPQATAVLYGVKPVMIAIVLNALCRLARSAAKTKFLAALGVGVAALSWAGADPLLLLLAAGVVTMLVSRLKSPRAGPDKSMAGIFMPWLSSGAVAGAAALNPFGLGSLFFFFLKVGSVLFGSGYVLLAFLRADLVERWHWLTEAQLLDAIAVGQITPGPIFTTATFIGYVLGGWPGALLATAGIFLPAFCFVALSGPLIPRLRGSALAGAFLDGINVGSLALMATVTVHLGATALVDWITVVLGILSVVLLVRFKVNSAWLILGGALIGYAVERLTF